MSKASNAALLFLEKNKKEKGTKASQEVFKESFEVQNPAKQSNFNGLFGQYNLTEEERLSIVTLLKSSQLPSRSSASKDFLFDCQKLQEITANLKGIKAQSILLQGEQLAQAQKLLKNYREGVFSRWLIATYGNRQTPYSILQYYEFHQKLTDPQQKKIEKMPKKAAYTLASREAPLEKKVALLEKYNPKLDKPADIILLVQENFPKKEADGRKGVTFAQMACKKIADLCSAIEASKPLFSPPEKKLIRAEALKLMNLLGISSSTS